MITRFYALNFTSGFHPEGEIFNSGGLFLWVVFSIETRLLRQQNQFFKFPRRHVLVTEISPIIVIQFWCFSRVAEEAGKLENVTGITVLKGDRYFSERVLCTSSSTLHLLNLAFKTN